MTRILQISLLIIAIPFIIVACQPIESYPLKKGVVEFNWEKCTALTARVIVLDRYPLEPPVYGRTQLLTRAADSVMITHHTFEFRGNLTLERYDNPENFQYASLKNTVSVTHVDTTQAVLWDVLITTTN
ncbi:hypothetical protein [Flammeovirga sp. SubArs3]|uniref:hypothetical protein n=1 Tax=Flammeovirga sp. SubArs3 TaxID=2995316 RepID=UPI00248ADAA3|nr:hypothetical protein [Flammeovirga sp. SubArs3]